MIKGGLLYLVATPIGNLEDITLRALKVLKNADIILTERKSTVLTLLSRYKVKPRHLLTYREDIHERVVSNVIKALEAGKVVALVSEAGTPVLSDPGLRLVHDVYEHFKDPNRIIVIPGPSAVVSAFVGFAVSSHRFVFVGFWGKKAKKILDCEFIRQLAEHKISVVVFLHYSELEALFKFLEMQEKRCKNIRFLLGIAKELTKLYETRWWGKIDDIRKSISDESKRGEFTVVISPMIE